ncbi:MAG: protein kinase [Gammaproteobacteria bacterium]
MSLKILVIDDHAEYRELLRHHITVEWPDAVVTEYDPTHSGRLRNRLNGAEYDVVLLDYDLDGDSGLEWLRAFMRRPGFPPVIFLAPSGDEQLAVKAIKAGAEEYLPKKKLAHNLLINAIREAARKRKRTAALFARPRANYDASWPGPVRIKGHRYIKQLATGSLSSVYLAESDSVDTQVVLKVLRQIPDVAEDASTFERFLQEYEVISRIDHPNVVKIYDIGIADDQVYIAMEYFPAGDLKARIKKPLPPKVALNYLQQMARALDAIHSVGVLHRDLKPGNVMLRKDDTLALIDFGLAKQLRLEADITGTGEIFGTPYYMSPEQGHADAVDERGDIYSLGVIFYEMLTGERPFVAATPMAVIYKHSHSDIPALPESLAAYQELVNTLLAKDPADRYQSADALLVVLSTKVPERV